RVGGHRPGQGPGGRANLGVLLPARGRAVARCGRDPGDRQARGGHLPGRLPPPQADQRGIRARPARTRTSSGATPVMTPHFDDALLLRYLGEELSPEEQSAIDAHLEVCQDRRCAEALERLARSPALSLPLFLKTTPDVPEPEGEPLPELPQRYEPLGLVGRGGMGLVLR